MEVDMERVNGSGADSLQWLWEAADNVRATEDDVMETQKYNTTQPQTEWEWETVGFREHVLFLYMENCIL